MFVRRSIAAVSIAAASVLVLAGCGGTSEPTSSESGAPAEESYYPITVTDLSGEEVTVESADRVGVTDNRFFQLAADWDLPVVVAPRALMSPNNPLKEDEDILDTGSHNEPNFEQFVAADPDVIINGYRYGSETGDSVREAAPDAAFVSMDGPEEQSVDEYVTQSITLMGEIFNKADEAQTIIDDFHASIDTAKEAYDPSLTVMGLVTSGGEINYSNPVDGRGASIFFDLLDLTPALDTEGSTDHTGDSVSLEALAEADPDYIIVLDRDAAVASDSGESAPALELITSSPSLAEVTAVKNDAIYVMPADYYLTEDVFAYTAVLDGLTDLFSSGQ